jgi:hypothetical protein
LRSPGAIQNRDGVAHNLICFQNHLIAFSKNFEISHTCPSSQDNGMVKCWGEKSFGKLGNGQSHDQSDDAVGDDPGGNDFFSPLWKVLNQDH